MPTTRRSAASARSQTGPTRSQSTISFSNKVTKDIPKGGKKKENDGPPTSIEIPEVEEKASATEHDSPRATRETTPCTQGSYAAEITREDDAEAGIIGHAVRDLDISRSAASSPWEKAEVEADRVSDAQIKRYWGGVEKQRRAPMVHLEGVDVWEKALRHFDVSSQYGVRSHDSSVCPCFCRTRLPSFPFLPYERALSESSFDACASCDVADMRLANGQSLASAFHDRNGGGERNDSASSRRSRSLPSSRKKRNWGIVMLRPRKWIAL